jgi:hypothetical protein
MFGIRYFNINLLVNLVNKWLHSITFNVIINVCLFCIYCAAEYLTCMYLSCISVWFPSFFYLFHYANPEVGFSNY